ncbi:MAG: hypothetical protein JKY14_00445 [Paraglaciecola sp.]|nr:hypothetical protein [Paraglaciecola sp.]
MQRYSFAYIHFKKTDLAQQRISGVFPLDEIDRALKIIADTLPLTIKTYTPLLTTITAVP